MPAPKTEPVTSERIMVSFMLACLRLGGTLPA